jgi:hypothetical protein
MRSIWAPVASAGAADISFAAHLGQVVVMRRWFVRGVKPRIALAEP